MAANDNVKGHKPEAERWPFTLQKVAFCNALDFNWLHTSYAFVPYRITNGIKFVNVRYFMWFLDIVNPVYI